MALSHLLDTTPPSLLATAACSGLRPEPDCRPRRDLLHLSYSCAPSYSDGARDTRPKADICQVLDERLISHNHRPAHRHQTTLSSRQNPTATSPTRLPSFTASGHSPPACARYPNP